MSGPTLRSTAPSRGRFLAVITAFLVVIGVDVAVLTHAEDAGAPGAGASGNSAGAHRAYPQKYSVDARLQRLTESLSLSAQQQQQVRIFLTRRQQQLERLHFNTSPSAVQRVHMLRSIDEQTVEQIKSVLTEEQRQKYSPTREVAEESALAGPSTGVRSREPSP